MEGAPGPNRHVRFGAFELDLRTHELERNGRRLKLRGHPVRVLEMLLENPGELVTREAIRQRLWPADTYVDFEHSLNNTVNRLREELGDRAEKPIFIETLPRQGYRFVAPVELPPNGSVRISPAPNGVRLDAAPAGQPPPMPAPVPAGRGRRRILPVAVPATILAALFIFVWWSWTGRSSPLRVTGIAPLTHDPKPKLFAGSDGTRLFVNRFDPPDTKILQMAVAGGQLSPFPTTVPVPWVHDVGSDGTLLMTSGDFKDGVWMIDASGNKLGHVLKGVNFASVAIAPDRETISYSDFNGEIHLIGKDGVEIQKVTSATDTVSRRLVVDLAWSPDGKTLRYTRAHKIWEVSAQGSTPRRVFPNSPDTVRECCGHWNRDGSSFVFVAQDSLERFTLAGAQVWGSDERRGVLRRSGGAPFPLTSPGPIRWSKPFTSNDGSKIYARGTTARGELDRYDEASKEFRPFLQGISAEYLAFSRDGNWVAYVTFPDGILWKARSDGTNAQQLTRPPLYPLWPRWSPDGSQILFTNAPDGLGPECAPWMIMTDEAYIIPAEGGRPRRLLPEKKVPIMYPDWSTDGRKIAFATCGSCRIENTADRKIAILDVASDEVTDLPGSENSYLALWSPDGRHILVMPINDFSHVKLHDVKTGRWSALDVGYGPSFPAWSHDGRYIYYAGSYFDAAIMRVPVTGGKREAVASIRTISNTGWFGLWVGLDPSDAPLLLRDTGTDELYALSLARK